MKHAALFLLTCFALPLWVGAKEKPKSKGGKPNKIIDMSAPADAGGGGLISTELGGREVEFFLKAYEIGGLETWLGEQAKTRGEADKVRAVGDALQSTQIEENELLAKLAKKKGVALAASKIPTALRKDVQAKLEKLKGAEFDATVMEQIALATQQAADSYSAALEAPDKDIRYFAQQILPMVKEKLVLAHKVSGKTSPPGAKPGFRENVPAPPSPAAGGEASDADFLKAKQDNVAKTEVITQATPTPSKSGGAATPKPNAAETKTAPPAATPRPASTPPPLKPASPTPVLSKTGAAAAGAAPAR